MHSLETIDKMNENILHQDANPFMQNELTLFYLSMIRSLRFTKNPGYFLQLL